MDCKSMLCGFESHLIVHVSDDCYAGCSSVGRAFFKLFFVVICIYLGVAV